MTMAARKIPVLTPQGHLLLAPADEARTLPGDLQSFAQARRSTERYVRKLALWLGGGGTTSASTPRSG